MMKLDQYLEIIRSLAEPHPSTLDGEYGYFCKYDELTDVVACPGIDFPTLKDSCYVTRESVFGPAPKE